MGARIRPAPRTLKDVTKRLNTHTTRISNHLKWLRRLDADVEELKQRLEAVKQRSACVSELEQQFKKLGK